MSIRRDPVYLSSDVWRALWLLAKAAPKPTPKDYEETRSISTPDEIADQILRQAIQEQNPQLFEHQKQIDKMEKELIKTLQ